MEADMAGASGLKTRVTCFPNGRAFGVLFPVFCLAVFMLCTWGAAVGLAAVHLHCERATGACAIVSSWGPFTRSRTLPLESIRGTRLDSVQGKRTTRYDVVLVTWAGDVSLSSFSSNDGAQRSEVKAEIDRCLGYSSAGFDVVYDEPHLSGLLIFAFGLLWLFSGWTMAQYARVEVDARAGTVDLLLMRWPASPQRRTFPLESVRDAIVADVAGPKGMGYTPALVVDGEERPVLLPVVSSSARKANEATVLAIQALLTEARAAAAPRDAA